MNKNLYWKQTAAVKVEDQLSDWIKIKRGVRQGCVLSPDLFSLYSEIILRKVEDMHGVVINGRNVNNTRYAEDTVLIAETEKDLQHILDKDIKENGVGIECEENILDDSIKEAKSTNMYA